MTNERSSERERNADSVARRDEGGGNGPRDATRATPETKKEAEKDGADKATKPLPGRGAGRQDDRDPGTKPFSRGG
jgi:hypothetical protein